MRSGESEQAIRIGGIFSGQPSVEIPRGQGIIDRLRNRKVRDFQSEAPQFVAQASLDPLGSASIETSKERVIGEEPEILSANGEKIISRHVERTDVTHRTWGIASIRPDDIPSIAKWFKVSDIRTHVYDEKVNPLIPKEWKPSEVARFEGRLERFLIPQREFTIRTKTPFIEGTPRPESKLLKVARFAHVALTKEKNEDGQMKWMPVGVQAWLNNDPYAPQEDREKIDAGALKVAYGHFMIVDPDPKFRNKGMALYMSTARADKLLGASEDKPGTFDQISTLVNYTGGDNSWRNVVDFFFKFGYEFDRRPEGRVIDVLSGEGQVKMYRLLITKQDWWRERSKAISGLRLKDIPYER